MSDTKTAAGETAGTGRAIDAAIQIGLLFLLVLWCFRILSPFLIPVLWGIIIAIGVQPLYFRLRAVVGERDKLAAVLFTLVSLALLITPSVFLAQSAIEGATSIATDLRNGTLDVPPPSPEVADWPLIGEQVHDLWSLAATNLRAAVEKAEPELREYGAKLVSAAAGVGMVILQFVISIIIAGVFLANPAAGRRAADAVTRRLIGGRGGELVELSRATIQSVVQGVLGVAFIQGVAAGLGMMVVGVPLAGLWAIAVLVVAVAQLPTIVVLGPVAVYVFSAESTTAAVLFLIWALLVTVSDTFLKPIFLGRGVDVPMLAVLLGAIGGMILHGIIGLFVGAVVLAVTYKLFQAWLGAEAVPSPQ